MRRQNRLAILGYGQWWRLITAGFLHGGIFHILMNSWVLYDLGAQVEHIYGTSRYLAIYLISSIGGFAASLFGLPESLWGLRPRFAASSAR
ncbi:MAG: rhomboid family intramembrane serine protease [Bryobacterales bacterium]